MGVLHFSLPAHLTASAAAALARTYFMGGMEYVPWPSEAIVEDDELTVRTVVDESGSLCAPWEIEQRGSLLLATATLMRREEPYRFLVELARGKVNQLRTQASEWESGGLTIPPSLAQQLQSVNRDFARVACAVEDPALADKLAYETLRDSAAATETLVTEYVRQVLQARLSRQDKLNTGLACRLKGAPPSAAQTALLKETFTTVQIPLAWPTVEAVESEYDWASYDALVTWALDNGFQVVAGPMIDFSPQGVPAWLTAQSRDARELQNFVDDFVELAIQRYRDRISTWQLTGASNWPSLLGLPRDELARLVARLYETAKKIDPNLGLVLGIAQPWGELLAGWEQGAFPFVFADFMLRNRVALASLEIEIVVGVQERGSFHRDLLEISRVLDLYALLGLPLRVTLGCPSAEGPDPQASYDVDSRGEFSQWSPLAQAEWVKHVAALALCKPYVEAVTWVHGSDAQPHRFPHCGLFDAADSPKPCLEPLRLLRQAYLR